MNRLIAILSACLIAMLANQAAAQTAQPRQNETAQVFAMPDDGVSFLTGDTWRQGSKKFRLYGIQSCIRGTQYTDNAGLKHDCGTVSLAMLAATIRDTKPTCSPIAQLPASNTAEQPTILVVCSAHVGNQSLDLGTVLITQGFAFAAFSNNAKPVYMPYLVAEAAARQAKAGLWAYSDMPHPNLVLFGAMKHQKQ